MGSYQVRLDRIEAAIAPCVERAAYRHRVIVQVGETAEHAAAEYAAARGIPVAEVEKSAIYMVIVEPPRRE
jgi:hypothetical protein